MERPGEGFDVENYDAGAFEAAAAGSLAWFRSEGFSPEILGMQEGVDARKVISIEVPMRTIDLSLERPLLTTFSDRLETELEFVKHSSVIYDPQKRSHLVKLHI
jgi:hypothetical protein